MDFVRDFLETSTIHGFAYVASTKSYFGKALWAFVIFTAFFFAGLIIYKSVNSWEEFPVSTTLSVHPIEELEFPAITVCPPLARDPPSNSGAQCFPATRPPTVARNVF